MTVFGNSRIFHKKFAFTVEIPGFGWTGFKACSELKQTVAVIEHYEGGAQAPNQSPGRYKAANVTLSRGASDDLDMLAWFKQVSDASAMVDEPNHQRTVQVVQRDRRQREKRRWVLAYAWPTEFTPFEGDNDADGITIESVVLAVRYISLGGENPA